MATIAEAQTFYYGVDASSDLQARNKRAYFASAAINRACNRILNETRPPFDQFNLNFYTEEERDTFENSAISGVFMYEGTPPFYSSYLIVAVGKMILCGQIRANTIDFRSIYDSLDPRWQHSYFCQALNILVWQNGKDYPLYWSGNPMVKMKHVTESEYIKTTSGEQAPMRIGNIMCFAHGRIFLATEQDLVYASDHILSQGFDTLESREAVLRFSESNYPSSGDGFGAPAELGSITGMVVMPRSNEINGHGDVVVLCENGAWSISPNSAPRNEWTTADIQRILFVGKGCVSPHSVVHFNNGIYYRNSDNGISNLLRNIYSYTAQSVYYDISDEISRYLDYDKNSPLVQFCHASIAKKRMFFTVGHEREISKKDGIHRYGKGIISYCFHKRDTGYTGAWEGIWTGPRPTGMVDTILDGGVRSIIVSYDSDSINRIYFLNEEESNRGSDFRLGRYQEIESTFTISDVFFDQGNDEILSKKKVDRMEYFLTESSGSISGWFSPDSSSLFYPLNFEGAEFIGCGRGSIRGTAYPSCPSVRQDNRRVIQDGYMFDFQIDSKGYTKFAKLTFTASFSKPTQITKEPCNISINEGISACSHENLCYSGFLSGDFNYTF